MSQKDCVVDSRDNNNKVGFGQRIESVKCLAVGAVTGSLAVAPVVAAHNLVLSTTTNGLAQFEWDTDMAAVQAGLFAIVYRYCVREDSNPQLGQGVVGAFCLTRTLSQIVVPSSCSALPLNCGAPLGYLDWSMLGQIAVNGVEAAVLFGATAAAMEFGMDRGYISRFPG